jgi:hypothetical protein
VDVIDSEDGGYMWSEQSRLSRGLHLNIPESRDVLGSDKEDIGSWRRVEECIEIY